MSYSPTEVLMTEWNPVTRVRVGEVNAWMCGRCGAIVRARDLHDAHHATLDAAAAGDAR